MFGMDLVRILGKFFLCWPLQILWIRHSLHLAHLIASQTRAVMSLNVHLQSHCAQSVTVALLVSTSVQSKIKKEYKTNTSMHTFFNSLAQFNFFCQTASITL